MSFREQRLNKVPVLPSPCRKVDVILLSDNRNQAKNDRVINKFRYSAFKQTQVDPLEQRINDKSAVSEESLEVLLHRVSQLERRVQKLQDLREDIPIEPGIKGRKRRRRFQQMQRNIQCDKCKKSYGSETALKYHCKLKHSKNQIQAYSSE